MAVRLWKMTYADGDIMFRRNKPNPRGIMKHTLTEGIFIPLSAIRKVECPECGGKGEIAIEKPMTRMDIWAKAILSTK